jgi:hypothetical protein
MDLDKQNWSGEGTFTSALLDRLQQIGQIRLIRVEDAPASRSEAEYNFVSNEIFVVFAARPRPTPRRLFGLLPPARPVPEKAMTLGLLEATLATMPDIGAPDYSDDSMLQFLRTERIVPPYQTRGYKLVELVRVYEAPAPSP